MKKDQMILKGDKWEFWLDGKRVTQKVYERRYPPPKDDQAQAMRFACGNWPVVSKLSLACDPSQVDEMNERNRRHGVNATYRPDGACVIQDESDYKKLRRLENVRDRDSYLE